MATETEAILDQRLIKAIAHPLRQRLLNALAGDVASPSQLAAKLGERLPNVAYHMKILEECGAIELVDTRPARGALEHFYRATARPFIDDEHWAELPLATRRALFDHLLQQIWEHVVAAAREGGFDHPRTHVSWMPLDLDDQGYEELADLFVATLDRVMELHAEAAARLAKQGDEERGEKRIEVAMMHFHRASDPAPKGKAPGKPGSRKPKS